MNPDFDDSILFRTGSEWQFNACINWTFDQHELYAHGYRQAAERLVASVTSDSLGLDSLVYPILFLYRHWFELRLKRIIDEGRQLLENGRGHPDHHKIHELWPSAKGIIRKVWKSDPPEYKLIDRIVVDFKRFDYESQAFRYPKDTNGRPHLATITHINIRDFAETMTKAADFLDGASSGISAYLSDLRNAY